MKKTSQRFDAALLDLEGVLTGTTRRKDFENMKLAPHKIENRAVDVLQHV
ncbi:MAG: hypothetical protein V1644_02175 [Candidatus Micrarchaeota archaeon]